MKGEDVRSTSSSRSGRCSRPFFRLSVIFCRSRSCCLDWSALPFPSAVFAPLPVSRSPGLSPHFCFVLSGIALSLSPIVKKGKVLTARPSCPAKYAGSSGPARPVAGPAASRASRGVRERRGRGRWGFRRRWWLVRMPLFFCLSFFYGGG